MKKNKISSIANALFVFVGSFLFFSWGTGNTSLWDIDEPIYAQALKEMMATGNLIVPLFNGHLLPDKPILNYLLMWAGVKIFGLNSFGLRIGSAIVGALLILLLLVMVKKLYNQRVAIISVLITATILHSTIIFRSATPDPLLILTVTASLTFFLYGYLHEEKRYKYLLLMYLAFAFATLDKGPIGFLLPGLIIVVFLISQNDLKFLLRDSRLKFGVPLFLLITLPWYVAVGIETHGAWDQIFFIQQNIGRFDSSMQGHKGPWFYYIISIFLGMLPWSIFFPHLLVWLKKNNFFLSEKISKKTLFMMIWAVVWAVFFSFSATKLPSYVWESYPPLAILLALYFDNRLRSGLENRKILDLFSAGLLLVIGLALCLFGGWILPQREPEIPNLVATGLPYLIGGIVAVFFLLRGKILPAMISIAISAVALSVLLVFVLTPQFNQLKPAQMMGKKISEIQQGNPYRLVAWNWFQPDFLFYAARGNMTVHRVAHASDVNRFTGVEPLYVVCPETDVKDLVLALQPPYQADLLMTRFEIYDHEKISLLRITGSS
ncbi:ArnT family glycosyltransferase [Acidithiobacillus sp. IBUN Pt1247-S3]|uniref:ArnT family glycosyltransferase n=1 Tax=Acidithiobacillus sp. IBUN Pt1247-S3 TaxID=3166642 RepID=UPI0034E4EF1F